MNKEKKEWIITFIPISIILIFALALIYYNYEFDCGSDTSCYNKHLESCRKAKLSVNEEGSTFTYRILGTESNRCKVEVKIVEMPDTIDRDIYNLFIGKSMTCLLSKDSTFNTEILPYCSGPLKEALYELMIQKFYDILAQSLGDIISGL